jgi:hypothetical protein
MQIIELFLPLDTGSGVAVEVEVIEGIVKGLADRFGGATAFTREPASGLWKRETTIERDRIIVVEVVVDQIDEEWWFSYRKRLEKVLEQERVMVRVTACRLI